MIAACRILRGRFKTVNLTLAGIALCLLASPALAAQAAKTEGITNVWTETDIRAALGDMSQETGVNIVVDRSVQGSITFEARNMPLEKCLSAVLAPGGFVYRKIDDYYLVGSAEPGSPSFPLLAETKTVVLKYTNAVDVRNLLTKCFGQYVQIGNDKSVLTVTAPRDLLASTMKAIENIDVAPKQVLIEAIVTELSEDAGRELGVGWEWRWDTSTLKPDPTSTTIEGTKGDSTASGIVDMTQSNSHFPGSLSFATTGGFTRLLKFNLQLLVSQGRAKIRACPRIMALNGTTAELYVGSEQYYALLVDSTELLRAGITAVSSFTVQRINDGVMLRITPRISDDGQITVLLAPEVSEVTGLSKQGLPILNKRTATATVRVRSGETIVLGGLTQEFEQTITRKVPVLGDIPLLGWLFKTEEKRRTQKEVAILITPRVLSYGQASPEEGGNVQDALERRIQGMADDIAVNNMAGIRSRLADLDRRLPGPPAK